MFNPLCSGARDLLVDIDGKFYGIQCKSNSKPYKDKKRKAQRYKFNFHISGKPKYDPEVVQIFACVCLPIHSIIFFLNKGQLQHSIPVDEFCIEKEAASFEAVLQGL